MWYVATITVVTVTLDLVTLVFPVTRERCKFLYMAAEVAMLCVVNLL